MAVTEILIDHSSHQRLKSLAKRQSGHRVKQRKLANVRYEEKRSNTSNKTMIQKIKEQKRLAMQSLRERNKVETISQRVGLGGTFVAYKIPDKYLKYPAGGIGYGRGKVLLRLRNNLGFKVMKQNVDDVMSNVELREALCLGDSQIEAPCLVRDGQQVTKVLAFHHNDLLERVVDDGTLFGKWIGRDPSSTTAAHLHEFLSLMSNDGNALHDCIPKKEKGSKIVETLGQSVIQEGTMITASKHNAKSYMLGNDGEPSPKNGFFLVRGKMEGPNKTTDIRCKELITPACALAHKALHGFPKKMHLLQEAVSKVFDGSKRISYTNILLTIANKQNDESIVLELNCDMKWQEYQGNKAGCVLHNDANNMPGAPAVAVVLGAYDDFDFYLPTCRYRIKAPSGTVLCGELADILYGVGSGTGIRLTICFAQHECAVTGVLRGANGEPGRAMVGARLSVSDRERIKKGLEVAQIKGLSMYDFC
jgi:hypothetical protein